MNKERRARLEKAANLLDDAKVLIEECRDEEQDYYDNMPESLQGGDKGQMAEAAVDQLDNAVSFVEEAIDALNEAQQ